MTKKWYQKISNWLTILACIILIPILIINLWIIIQANQNKEEVPSIFGYKPFIVLSGSMESQIFKGDLIITKEVDPKDLKIEDIIAFRDEYDTVTTHRIIDIVEKDGTTYFVTKGDNNTSQDQNLVEYKDVEGLYKSRIPKVGNILTSLSEPTVIIIIILIITIIFGAAFMKSSKKENELERLEFEEFKRQKEAEKKEFEEYKKQKLVKESTGNKTSSKKKSSNSKEVVKNDASKVVKSSKSTKKTK